MDETPALSSDSHSRAAAFGCLFYFAIAIVIGVRATRYFKSPKRRAMESLAQFALDHGGATTVPTSSLKFFGMPTDGATFTGFQAVTRGQQSDTERAPVTRGQRTKAFLVRERSNPRVLDIFFVDLPPNENSAGYYYSASVNGRLIKGVYIDDRPMPFSDAEQQFEREKEFWYAWLQKNHPRTVRSP